MARNAVFTNIDSEVFIGKWDSKERPIKAGQSIILPEWLAEHYGKHLTNHLLIKSGKTMNESYTSPKKPADVPEYKKLFDKIVTPHGERQKDAERDELDAEIELLNAGIDTEEEEEETLHTEEGVDASDDEYAEDEPEEDTSEDESEESVPEPGEKVEESQEEGLEDEEEELAEEEPVEAPKPKPAPTKKTTRKSKSKR